jgi:choline dehydrogenase
MRRLGQGARGVGNPGVQCVFAPANYKPGLIRKLHDKPGITGGPGQMRPLSRSYVLVRSPDPREQPAINPRYLAEDTDRRAMVGGLKFLRRLFAAPSLAKYISPRKSRGRRLPIQIAALRGWSG